MDAQSDENRPINAQPAEEGQEKVDGWAGPTGKLHVESAPAEAVNLNVDGRRLSGPAQGFGQLWRKTYRVRLSGVDLAPAEVIQTWREHFSEFWPQGNEFYAPLRGIQPGEVALLNLTPGNLELPGGAPGISTGVLVIYVDQESFAFMTPQGHMLSAIITFSAYDDDSPVAQVQALVRPSDPLYEMMFRLGVGHRMEDDFWEKTLINLAAYFGVAGYVKTEFVCLDTRLQWGEAKNIWHNAAIRTTLYHLAAPFRWVSKQLTGKPRK